MVNHENVLNFVRSSGFRQMTTEEMERHFSVEEKEGEAFLQLLHDLERQGQLVNIKKERWVNPDHAGLLVGRLQCNPRGFGFVLPERRDDQEDVYVADEDMGPAMHGDLVVAEVHSSRRRGRRKLGPSGRVIKVIEHRNEEILGTFAAGRKFGRVVPNNPRLFRDVYVAREDWAGAKERDQVLVKITDWPSLRHNPEGEISEVLGKVNEVELDVPTVILEFGLARQFPPEALREAERIPRTPPEAERKGRHDFRGRITVTIDPEDAKDYDDALSLYKDEKTGDRIVLVHIADFSCYVKPDGPLDLEARRRGASVYLANEVVRMLPPEQSRYTFSLVEGEDRLAKTVVLRFDDAGEMLDYSICRSVVRVDRCMNYPEAQRLLEALDSPEDARAAASLENLPESLWRMLGELDELARQLGRRRRKVGSIDLDMPDYKVGIDEDGRVVSVSQIVRDRSHGLVEEFMLSANRAVAAFLCDKKLPGLYRIHEPPPQEDLEEFSEFIKAVLGRGVDAGDRKALQRLLADVSGTHLAEAVNMQLLRSMQRAIYSPSVSPHYALNFDRYCHFTSPVRRYPDLLVHQVLDAFLKHSRSAAKLRAEWRPKLPRIASHCNEMQQRADEAEREIIKIKLLRYLEAHREEVFDGVITGVLEIGIFVRLQRCSVEGLVKVQDIRDDFYKLDERRHALVGTRTGRELSLGQRVEVVISDIDTARRRLDLLLHG